MWTGFRRQQERYLEKYHQAIEGDIITPKSPLDGIFKIQSQKTVRPATASPATSRRPSRPRLGSPPQNNDSNIKVDTSLRVLKRYDDVVHQKERESPV